MNDRTVHQDALRRLRIAFAENRFTLFVGAGVSMDSGLPSWRALLANLYANSGSRPRRGEPALDFAAAEWFFDHDVASLEIAARKIRASYGQNDFHFHQALLIALYGGTGFDWAYPRRPNSGQRRAILRRNLTLRAVLALCRQSKPGRRGLRRVITYNYDNLLEIMLPHGSTQPMWAPTNERPRALPICHVHGYVPANVKVRASQVDDIVLSEEQYNRVTNDPYSWRNLVQLQAISSSVCLAIGLSLDDRNLRRLLDATRNATRPEFYALLRRPQPPELNERDIREITQRAQEMFGWWGDRVYGGKGVDPKPLPSDDRVRRIVTGLHRYDLRNVDAILNDLGIRPLWYEDVREVAAFVPKIAVNREGRRR